MALGRGVTEGREQRPTIGVVGAGVAGLVAAKMLAEAGAQVVVFEAASRPGGRTALSAETSFEYRGVSWHFELEHAIHGVWRQYRNLRRMLAEHGLLDRLVPASEQELIARDEDGRVRVMEFGAKVRGSHLPDPLAMMKVLAVDNLALRSIKEGPHRFLGAGSELLHALAFDSTVDIPRYDRFSVDDFIHNWPPLLQRVAGILGHTAFYRESDRVSLAAFMTGLHTYFLTDKRDSAFDVFATDIQTDLLRPLAGAIRARGGHLRTSTRVEGIDFVRDEGGLRAEALRYRRQGSEKTGRTQVDGVVLAMDPKSLGKLLRDGQLASALHDRALPEGVSSTVVRLWFSVAPEDDRASSGVFHALDADNFFWLHRLQLPYRAFHLETGGSVLECHLYARRGRLASQLGDDALIAKVMNTVRQAWPNLDGHVAHAHVQRNPPTNVAFGPGVMSRLPHVTTEAANVALCGDWIACQLPVLYLERACTTALHAARRVGLSCGLSAWDLPDPLPPHPPAASVRRAVRVARSLRKARLLPRIGRKWL